GAGLADAARQDQARLGAERVGHGAREVGLEHHVGLADVAPSRDRRAVEHHAVLQVRLADAARREAEMLPAAAPVGEAEVDGLDAVAADLLEDGLRVRHPGYPWSIDRSCLRHWTGSASAEPPPDLGLDPEPRAFAGRRDGAIRVGRQITTEPNHGADQLRSLPCQP